MPNITYGRKWGPTPNFPCALKHKAELHPELRFIAGPCAVEGEEFIINLSNRLKEVGATMLRGGCYRYGTYPPDGNAGLQVERSSWLCTAAHEAGLPWITEVMDRMDLTYLSGADWLQIGMRHAQHYPLLRAVGEVRKPVLLKRGTWMTLDETLGAVEYLLKAGASEVAVCERGITSFEDHCRWTFSTGTIAKLKAETGLLVVGDPSHGSGDSKVVPALARSAVAAGSDGIMVEVHPDPPNSASDAEQAITIESFKHLVGQCNTIRMVNGE